MINMKKILALVVLLTLVIAIPIVVGDQEKRYCAHVYAEFDNSETQVDIWAHSSAQARCMIEAVMESFPAGDGGYDLYYGCCSYPSGDKIHSENYPSCSDL